jgi:hypothetical protein
LGERSENLSAEKPKYELQEALCVPEDEQSFLKTVREPADPEAIKK